MDYGPAHTLVSDFWPTELWENPFPLFVAFFFFFLFLRQPQETSTGITKQKRENYYFRTNEFTGCYFCHWGSQLRTQSWPVFGQNWLWNKKRKDGDLHTSEKRTEEPGRLRSTGSQRVGHDLSDLAQQRGNCLQQELGDIFKYISRVLFRESLCFSKSSFGERDFLLIKSLLIFLATVMYSKKKKKCMSPINRQAWLWITASGILNSLWSTQSKWDFCSESEKETLTLLLSIQMWEECRVESCWFIFWLWRDTLF